MALIQHHPVIRRLAHISQLGVAPLVFQHPMYTRLEHSRNVARLAQRAGKKAAVNSGLEWQPRYDTWMKLGGLFHDCGHGPWSHVFDAAIQTWPHRPAAWIAHHEQRGQRLIRYALGAYGCQFNEDDITAVQSIVSPPADARDVPSHVPVWMTEIVANKTHGVDVDRLDYLMRDSMIYQRLPRSVEAPVDSLKAGEVHDMLDHACISPDGHWTICEFNIPTVYHALKLRTHLHRHLYQHPDVKALELALIDELHQQFNKHSDVFQCLRMQTDEDCQKFLTLDENLSCVTQNLRAYQYSHTAVPVLGGVMRGPTYQTDTFHVSKILPNMLFHRANQRAAATALPLVHADQQLYSFANNQEYDDSVMFWK